MGENRAFQQRQLADLHKNLATLETGIGYALFQIGEGAAGVEDFARYTQFEQQKQGAANRIELIQELVATQNDVGRQLAEVDVAGKRLAVELNKAYAALGTALADEWPDALGDFCAVDYGAVLALRAKLQGTGRTLAESDDEGDGASGRSKLQAIQQFFSAARDRTAMGLATMGRGQLQHRTDKAAEKLGRTVFESQRLDEAAASGALSAAVLAQCDLCKDAVSRAADLAERRSTLKAQHDATAQSLKAEGAMGAGRVRIEELKKHIRVATAAEDALALQTGRAFADTVFDTEGTQVKKPETAAKKAAPDHADTQAELVSKLTDDGRVRTRATACILDIQLLDVDHELAALGAKMVKGNERIAANKKTIEKLTADNADTAAMITTSNDLSQKMTADREALVAKRAALLL
jgi:hypothetical protein